MKNWSVNIINTLFRIFLNFLLGFLSFIIPKNNNQIILGSGGGITFFDNSKYFYLYLLNRKDNNQFKKIYWITKSKKVFHKLNQKNMPVIRLYSFEGFAAILRSKFIVTTHTGNDISYFLRLPGRFNKIQALHGAPLKGTSPPKKKNLKSFVNYLSNKERFSYKTIISATNETKKFEVYYKNFTVIGCPRNDILINNNYLLENYKKELFLNNYSKVILYAPTFRDKTPSKIPFSELFLKKLNEYLVEQNSILLLKGHYWGRSNIDIGKFSNIQDVSEIIEDVNTLLIHIDVLITDYSAVVIDFLLLDKPIIFYPYDFNEYLKNRIMFVDYFNDLPGPFVKTEEEFFECIKSVEENFKKSEYQKKFVDFKNKYHKFQDGNSSQRLYEYLIKNS